MMLQILIIIIILNSISTNNSGTAGRALYKTEHGWRKCLGTTYLYVFLALSYTNSISGGCPSSQILTFPRPLSHTN